MFIKILFQDTIIIKTLYYLNCTQTFYVLKLYVFQRGGGYSSSVEYPAIATVYVMLAM